MIPWCLHCSGHRIPGGGSKDLTCYTAKQNNNKNLSESRINLLKKKNGDDSQASLRTKWTGERPTRVSPQQSPALSLSPCTFCCPSAPGNTGGLLRGPGPIPSSGQTAATHRSSDHTAVPYLTPSSWAPQAPLAPGPHLVVLREPRLQKHPGRLQPGHPDHTIALILPERPACGWAEQPLRLPGNSFEQAEAICHS